MPDDTLKVEAVPIGRLFCSPSNPRINDEAVPYVAASIRRFGWQQPIVVRPSGEVIAGNTRLKAAQELGHEEVPVIWFNGSDLEAASYAIADNRTHEFASWDEPALARLLTELREEDALDGVGFSAEDIDALFAGLEADLPPADIDDPGPAEPPDDPVTQPGNLWILGEHRLLCGDSTKSEDVARVLGDDVPALMATDPPYCVDYTGANRPNDAGKDWSDKYNEVEIKDLGEFLRAVLKATLPRLRKDAAIYIWHAHLQYPVIDAVLGEFGILRHQPIIWAKPCATFTHSYYRWQHEPCIFGWQKGHKPPRNSSDSPGTVWEIDWEGKQRIVGNEHPTQKPTRLFEIPMEQHTRRDEVVFEPFSGSGSQLIAAERLGRKCRALEISPAFVDVAVRRWQEATGNQATLDGSGTSFSEADRQRTQQELAPEND